MGGRDKEGSLGVGVIPFRDYFVELEFSMCKYKSTCSHRLNGVRYNRISSNIMSNLVYDLNVCSGGPYRSVEGRGA